MNLRQRRGQSHSMIAGGILNNPGGLVGVWAPANTRGDIWDALARREAFGTSGTRIQVRMFGGFGLTREMVGKGMVEAGEKHGVPMGGDLHPGTTDQSIGFLLWAMKDPDAANLDKIQIVKGWVTRDGEMHERVYDALAGEGRERDSAGRFLPVGETVHAATATYSNRIGEPLLVGYWEDPDFDPELGAFYYARVLQIPTPRYSTYDARRLGEDPATSGVPIATQERAWTSPIWVTKK